MPTLPGPLRKPWIKRTRKEDTRGSVSENQKFYNSFRWRKTAKRYERKQPTCEHCEKRGKVTDATGRLGVTDHIYPVKRILDDLDVGRINATRAQYLLYDHVNHQRLCHSCHAKKTRKEQTKQ